MIIKKIAVGLLIMVSSIAYGANVLQTNVTTFTQPLTVSNNIIATGSVGIGTNNPGAKLHVKGSGSGDVLIGEFPGAPSYGCITLNGVMSTTNFNFASASGDALYINRPVGQPIRIREGNTLDDQMTFLSGGNVGIGTNAPSRKFHVQDVTGGAQAKFSYNDSLYTELYWYGMDVWGSSLNLRVDGDTKIIATTAGNVGIGTNAPGAVLDIGHATSPTLRLSRKGAVAATSQPGLIDTYAPNASGGLLQWSTMKTVVDDATAGTEDSSIQFATVKAGALTDTLTLQSGNVGIGTNAPSEKLEVAGKIALSDSGRVLVLNAKDTGDNDGYATIKHDLLSGGTSSGLYVNVRSGGSATPNKFIIGDSSRYTFSTAPFIVDLANQYTLMNGNVGIGTNAPSSKLHIADNAPAIRLQTKTAGTIETPVDRKIIWGNYADAEVGSINLLDHSASEGRADMTFSMNHSDGLLYEDMRIRNGNVGIGTNVPATKLDVNGALTLANANQIYTRDSGGTARRFLSQGDEWYINPDSFAPVSIGGSSVTQVGVGGIGVAGRSKFNDVLTVAGNVGIGTTNPLATLEVYKSGTDTAKVKIIGSSNTSELDDTDLVFGNSTYGNWARIITSPHTTTDGKFLIQTRTGGSAGSEVYSSSLMIDGTGKVGLGTVNPDTKLQVISGESSSGIEVADSSGGARKRVAMAVDSSAGFIDAYNVGSGPLSLRIQPNGGNSVFGGQVCINTNASGYATPLTVKGTEPGEGRIAAFCNATNDNVIVLGANNDKAYIESTYNIAAGYKPIAFVTTAAERMRITADGNVGIGTTNPAQSLHVYNKMVVGTGDAIAPPATSGTAQSGPFRVSNTSNAGIEMGLYATAPYAAWIQGQNFADMSFTQPLVLNPLGGNVGIGTNAPANALHIHNASAAQLLVAGYSPSSGRTNVDSGAINLGSIAGYHGALDYDADGATTFNIDNTYDHVGAKIKIRMRTTGTPVDAITVLGSGNVGIGTSTPLNNLVVSKAGAEGVEFAVGAEGNFNDTIHYNRNTGVYITNQLTADTHVFLAGSPVPSERMRIGANGNVGIGTSTPKTNLNIYSYNDDVTAMLEGNLAANKASVDFKTVAGNAYVVSKIVGAGEVHNDAGYLAFHTRHYDNGLLERMRINYDGNVGIGTSTPEVRLQVQTPSASSVQRAMRLVNPAALGDNVGVDIHGECGNNDLGTIRFTQNGSALQRVEISGANDGTGVGLSVVAGGNVGIGTNSPGYPLVVHGGPGNGSVALRSEGSYSSVQLYRPADGDDNVEFIMQNLAESPTKYGYLSMGTGTGKRMSTADNDDLELGTIGNANLVLGVNNTEKMRITGTGVGIGITSPTAKLHVLSADANPSLLSLVGTNEDANPINMYMNKLSASPADSDEIARIYMQGKNDVGTLREYVLQRSIIDDVTDGTEDSSYETLTYKNGAQTSTLMLKSGNVGIGTANPTAKLYVSGNMQLDGDFKFDAGSRQLWWTNTTGQADSRSYGFIGEQGTYGRFELRSSDASDGVLDRSVIAVDKDGKVGIGTNAPATKLHVVDNNAAGAYVKVENPGNQGAGVFLKGDTNLPTYIYNQLGKFVVYNSNVGENLVMDVNGKVGIGTTNPGKKLTVSDSAAGGGVLRLEKNTARATGWHSEISSIEGNNYDTIGARIVNYVTDGGGAEGAYSGWKIYGGYNGTDYLGITVNEGGAVGIRTNNPAAVLDVNGNSIFRDNVGIGTNNPSHLIHLAGGAYCDGTGDWIAGSDIKWKKDIVPLSTNKYGIDTVLKMSPVTYVHKNDTNNTVQLGFIAQDMKPIVPEVVTGKEGDYGIAYARLIPVLVNAIKEQDAIIKNLQKRVEALENGQPISKNKPNKAAIK